MAVTDNRLAMNPVDGIDLPALVSANSASVDWAILRSIASGHNHARRTPAPPGGGGQVIPIERAIERGRIVGDGGDDPFREDDTDYDDDDD